jgi:L-ascorbate metabolism protein UlaG (beta-lactamase superfamily)
MHPLTQVEVAESQVALHWFEQSSFALKDARGTIVQIDPYFPRERPAERFLHATAPLDEAELPTDYVLLTHSHNDHTCSESIARIWQAFPRVRFVGPHESIDKIVAEAGVDPSHTRTLAAGDTVALGTITVHAVYAKPPDGDPASGIAPPDVTHLGYVIEIGGVRLYVSGDPIHTFADLDTLIEPVAALKPDLGLLTTHPSEGEFPFFDGCANMARRIGLRQAVPAHRACFVKRDYDPQDWAAHFSVGGPQPLIVERNLSIVYP